MEKIKLSPALRMELEEFLGQLEKSISEDFDRRTSRLIDCVHVLLEEG